MSSLRVISITVLAGSIHNILIFLVAFAYIYSLRIYIYSLRIYIYAKATKNIRILCIEPAKTVIEMTLNELIKLTTL